MLNSKTLLNLCNSGLVPFLVGPRGEGKTTFIREISTELKKSLTILNLSAIEASDFCGLPYIQDGLTLYAKPSFLDSDILFLDEMDRVRDSSVKSALLSLLNDKKINGHDLKKDCLIFSAGNGQAGNYDTVEFCDALEDRIFRIDFSYSVQEKIDYLKSKYPKNNFTKFLEIKPETLETYSTRRVEAMLKVNDNGLMSYFLGHEVERLYRHFIESNLVTISDIKSDSYDFSQLSTISKTSLIIDLVNEFYDFNLEASKNINKFISLLRPEEKAGYFSRLKKLCIENSQKFKVRATILQAHDFFKGQKEFLNELTK